MPLAAHTPGSGKAREYILYGWQPPLYYRQGPYYVVPMGGYIRCSTRPGTWAHKRQQLRQAREKQADEAGWFLVGVIGFFALAALFHHCL
jgi:hypothetical protein